MRDNIIGQKCFRECREFLWRVTRGSSTVEVKKRGRKWEKLHLETRLAATIIDPTHAVSIPGDQTLSLSATWIHWLHKQRDKKDAFETERTREKLSRRFPLNIFTQKTPAPRDTSGRALSRLDMLFPVVYRGRGFYRYVTLPPSSHRAPPDS